MTRGRRLRSDSTVVETTIHHPGDSSLLSDGVRVLSWLVPRAKGEAFCHTDSPHQPRRTGEEPADSILETVSIVLWRSLALASLPNRGS